MSAETNKALVRREFEGITGITIDRFADGRIVEEWTNFDALGLLQHIGLIPESQEIEA
jgi:hypothetical protein